MTKLVTLGLATLLAAGVASKALADDNATCAGRVDLGDKASGCDIELTQTISLAKCDFRPDQAPSVRIFNVRQGSYGGSSTPPVTVTTVSTGSFTVTIEPQARLHRDGTTYCKVRRFDWSAE